MNENRQTMLARWLRDELRIARAVVPELTLNEIRAALADASADAADLFDTEGDDK